MESHGDIISHYYLVDPFKHPSTTILIWAIVRHVHADHPYLSDYNPEKEHT